MKEEVNIIFTVTIKCSYDPNTYKLRDVIKQARKSIIAPSIINNRILTVPTKARYLCIYKKVKSK